MASAKRRLALGVWRIMWHLLRHICVALQRTLGRKVFTVGKAADWPQSAADHEWMRQACQTGTEMVRAVQEAAPEARIFKPAPVDQMYQGAAVSFTYFFKDHNLQPDLLKRALQRVLGELPHLAGRGRVLGRGNRLIDSVIECTNEGVVVATASARNIRFTNGKEAPMQIRALSTGQVVAGQALKAGSMLLHSPADLMEALADDVSSPWEPNPVSTRMSLKQWLSAPFLIYRTIKSRWDVHMIYLPGEVVARVKAATIGGFQISTNDAVQAMIFTLYNDLRGKPLVPTSPQMFTVTADILHGRNLKDTMLPDQYFGNAVEVVFLEGGVKANATLPYLP
ncbi:hypothetical protein CHLNCDRAFT_139681 [Chlorella variabilis]|uniref:Amine oxidase domain-containing protein n=1 Tax=Chlorella variabilis TaxID=554065 RepID=E1ZQP3_CHLVA|nr:hypothetical protein CHLNCDRAFT_139681 [Chlorella variabilis]EFN51753.1 hypothetical protein CHLNCDRAFT_139681 [Chlorella variabilis]|eukprot:XP_005843855.1 hypothetical protein CHLNCDRAFT_139681 [Chlorella variabilis]